MNHPAYHSEHLLELMFENNHMPVALMDTEFNFLRVNHAYAAADGKEPDYFSGKNHFDLYPHADNERIFRQVVRTGQSYYAKAKPFEYEHAPERGITHWDWTLVPVRDNGVLVGVMLQLVDVTQHIVSKEKLNKEKLFNNAIINTANAIVVVLDKFGTIREFNRAAEELTFYNAEEVIGQSVWDIFILPEEIESVKTVFSELEHNAIPNQFTNYWLAKDKSRILINWNNSVILDNRDEFEYVVSVGIDITEKREAENKLHITQLAVEHANSAIAMASLDNKLVHVNQAFLTMWGYDDKSEVLGRSPLEFWKHPEQAQQVINALKQENKWKGELIGVRKDGSEIILHLSAGMTLDPAGKPINMMATFLDVTEHRKTEQELQRQRDTLTAAQEIAHIGTWDWDITRNKVLCSEEVYRIFGINKNEFRATYDHFRDYVHKDDRQRVDQGVEACLLDIKIPYRIQHRIVRPDGDIRHVEEVGRIYRDESGTPVRMIGVVQDISERKQSDEKLRETTRLLENIVENVPNMIFLKSATDLRFEFFNKAGEQLLGLDRSELLGKNDFDLFPKQQAEFFTNKDRMVLKSKKVLDIPEEKINTEQGRLSLHTKKIAIRDEQGRPKYLLGISEDITKSKQALKELERQREIVTNLTDNLPGMIYQCRNDENWTLDFANVGVKDITGYDRGVLLKGDIHYGEIIHPDDQDFVWKEVQAALDKKVPFTIRYRITNADKQVRWVWERGAGFYDRKGNLEFLHGFISDITEQKAIEEQLERHSNELEELVKERTQQLKDAQGELIKNERLAVLGQLTATVSHELRNPLGAIRMSVHLVDKEINRSNTKLLNSIERIKRNIAHCDTIIDELLDFTNTRELNKEAIELDTFIAEQISEFEWNKDISVSKNLNCHGMELLVDRDRLRRILINAFQNAQQAILSEKLSKLKQAKITITTALNNQEVEIKIQDNGPGIPDKFQSKIFEPLFSTKSFGVGLGMNVIQQVMQQHAGGVEVKSEEGEGTEIRLWFPLVD